MTIRGLSKLHNIPESTLRNRLKHYGIVPEKVANESKLSDFEINLILTPPPTKFHGRSKKVMLIVEFFIENPDMDVFELIKVLGIQKGKLEKIHKEWMATGCVVVDSKINVKH